MMGESLMDTSSGYDTVLYHESLGVFTGIIPFNFPAMIPMGWMTPICIATGNTIVLKAATMTPQSALKLADLYREAGLPGGVVNVVTCSRNQQPRRKQRGMLFSKGISPGFNTFSVYNSQELANLRSTLRQESHTFNAYLIAEFGKEQVPS
jgi:hypothetical protein